MHTYMPEIMSEMRGKEVRVRRGQWLAGRPQRFVDDWRVNRDSAKIVSEER
jgi:hypothetical protein